MGRKIIYSAIKNRKITLFIVALIMIHGIYSYYIIPKQETPDLVSPVAIITTIYPGASPEEVERLVTRKIEDEIVKVDGYGYSNSYSNNSISIVVVRLEYGTDIEKAWDDTRRKMEDLQNSLPEGTSEIDINTNLIDTAGIIVAISGDNYSYEELSDYAKIFKNELSKIDGISKFDIDGEQKKEVVIDVDMSRLNFHTVSMTDISNIIQAQNIEIPSGRIGEGKSKINVKTPGAFSTISEIKNTIIDISKENGSMVRVNDIADVGIKYKDTNAKVKFNGKNAVLVTGYFKQDKNIIPIGNEVSKKIAELKKSLPDDITVGKVLYQPEDVKKSVNGFIMNLIEGIIFVIIVVFISMGVRNAIIVSAAIPISILITISAMNAFGIKMHQISIAALIIALGMLVDNAIVISDAIQNRVDNGEEKYSACVEGVREVAIPVLTSTLTTIAAFTPLVFLSSIAGEYISSLPIIVITSLLASYLTALLVTPTMAYIFFKKSDTKGKTFRIRGFFERLLVKGMKKEGKTIFFICLAIVLTVFVVNRLGLQFFPKADKDIIYIDIKTEQNIDIANTEMLVDKVSKILEEQPEVVDYTAAIGRGLPKFYNSTPIVVSSPDIAQILLKIDLDKKDRFKNNYQLVDYLQDRFDTQITGGTVLVKQLEIGEPIGSPVRVRVTGDDIERLGEISKDIRLELAKIDGTVNIQDDFNDRVYEFEVNVDDNKASLFGVTKYDVQREINTALMGTKSSMFRRYDKDMDIIVKSNIKSIEQLENLAIKSPYTSNKVLLKEIADISLRAQIPTITKYDRDYAVMITSDVKSGVNSVNIQNELAKRLEKIDASGVEIAFDGEREKIRENFGSIGSSALFAVLLIYSILLFQFKSFVQPMIILLTIPLSAIGSIFGLYILRQPLSFMALFGMVSLMGIVVNNAIVLIDYINAERREGKSIHEACLSATGKRFRPIMLSSMTTVIGLTPLVFSGSELFRPMAISLMSGLLISTLLTLVIIPIAYNGIEGRVR